MKTELLIARLARDARPVTVLPPPRIRLARWAIVALVSVMAGIVSYGLRGDAASRVWSPDFIVRVVLVTAVAVAAARHALSLSVPGAEPDGMGRLAPPVLLAAWAVVLAAALPASSPLESLVTVRWHPRCAWQMAAVAVVPSIWLLWQIRRGAPYAIGAIGLHLALAAAGAGAVAVQWICGLDGAAHHLAWHVMPVLVLTATAGVVVRRLLRRH